jgi:WD40 repeat protein
MHCKVDPTFLKKSLILCVRLALPMILFLSACTAPTPTTAPPGISTETPAPPLQTIRPSDTPTKPKPPSTSPTQTSRATNTETPVITSSPTVETSTAQATPERVIIEPGNAASLQVVNSVVESETTSFVWMPEGEELALAKQTQVLLFDLPDTKDVAEIAADQPTYLAASPDRNQLAWGTQDNKVQLWHAAGDEETITLQVRDSAVTSLTFSPTGEDLAASVYDRQVFLWDAASGEQKVSWEFPYFLTNLSFSPDSARLAGADPENFTVHIWDKTSGDQLSELAWTDHASPVLYGAFFSPDWKTVAWVARGTVQLMDVASGDLGPALQHEDFVNADVAWSPDGTLLASASAATVNGEYVPVVIVWDAQTGEKIQTLPHEQPVISLAFSPSGRELASLSFGGKLQIWAVPTQP